MKSLQKTLISIYLAYFFDYFGYAIVFGVFGPLILDPELGMFAQETTLRHRSLSLGILFAVYPLMQLIAAPIFGDLSDHLGRKKTFLLLNGGAACGYTLSGLAIMQGSYPLLLISRLLTGLFSTHRSICMASLSDLSPDETSRSKAYGVIATLGGISWVISMLVGGIFSKFSLISIPFWITTAFCAANLLMITLFFHETRKERAYAFRGCIPRENGVGATGFVLNDDPITVGAIGEECNAKDAVPTSALPGIDPVTAYEKAPFTLDFFKGMRKVASCFRIPGLRSLYVYYFMMMIGWGINLLWLNPYTLAHFDAPHTALYVLLASTGVAWSFGSAVMNKLLLRRFHPQEITRMGSIALVITFAACSILQQFIPFAVCALLASVFGALAWTNALSFISLSAPESVQGKVMGMSQSFGSIAFLVAPLFAGVLAGLNLSYVYPLAALFILASLPALSLSLKKQHLQGIKKTAPIK